MSGCSDPTEHAPLGCRSRHVIASVVLVAPCTSHGNKQVDLRPERIDDTKRETTGTAPELGLPQSGTNLTVADVILGPVGCVVKSALHRLRIYFDVMTQIPSQFSGGWARSCSQRST